MGAGFALGSGRFIPARCGREVLRNALAVGMHHTQIGLGLNLPAQRGGFITLQSLRKILRHTQTLGIHASQVGQGGAAGVSQGEGHVRLRGKRAFGKTNGKALCNPVQGVKTLAKTRAFEKVSAYRQSLLSCSFVGLKGRVNTSPGCSPGLVDTKPF